MSRSYYKNLLSCYTKKDKKNNWYNKIYRRVCKHVLRNTKDLSSTIFPKEKETIEEWDIQDVKVFGQKNKDKIRNRKQHKDE